MAQEITVVYGTLTMGGSTARILDGFHYADKGADEAEVEWSFVTTAASDAAFATEVVAIEAALRVPRAALLITANASTILTLSHTANTGFESRPVVVKEGTPGADSIRSRRYTVRVAFQLPADGTGGLRMGATFNIELAPSTRKRLTITGTYTALPDTGAGAKEAKTVYDENIGALVTAALAVAGLTTNNSELLTERYEPGTANKTIDFERVYQEILTEDVGAASPSLNVDNLVDQKIRVSRLRQAPGDTVLVEELGSVSRGTTQGGNQSGGGGPSNGGSTVTATQGASTGQSSATVDRLRHILVEYEAWTKSGDALALWDDTIYPYLKDVAQGFNGGRPVAVIRAEPKVGTSERQLLATMELLGEGEARIAELTVSTSIADESFGNVLIPVWNGNPYAYYKHPGPAVKVYLVRAEKLIIGSAGPDDLAINLGGGVGNLEAVPLSSMPERTQVRFGTPDAFIDGERVRLEGRAQLVQLVAAAGGGGGGTGPPVNPGTPTPGHTQGGLQVPTGTGPGGYVPS